MESNLKASGFKPPNKETAQISSDLDVLNALNGLNYLNDYFP